MKKYILHFIKLSLALILLLQVGEVSAQSIPASNSTAAAIGIAPTGWITLQGTTDVSNRNGWAGTTNNPWSGTVSNPPNGHTVWVNGFGNEVVGTTISGLTIGRSYSFTFNIAELQSAAGGTINTTYDGVFEVGSYTGTLNSFTFNSLATYPFTGGSSTAWSEKTFAFTATATTFKIGFI
jgi:hypothetical protein